MARHAPTPAAHRHLKVKESIALDQFAVVAGIQGRDRRRIDGRMLQTCLSFDLSDPFELEKFFDQAEGIRGDHGQDPGRSGRRIGEPVTMANPDVRPVAVDEWFEWA
jgi:hypothetical protein